MADTVKIPGIGPVKKTYVYVGIALAGGILLYAWWNYATSEEPSADYTEEDIDYAYRGGVDEYEGAIGSDFPGYQDLTPGTPKTNAQWTQQAIEMLTEVGYEGPTVAASLGKYLARLCMTSNQADIARQAVAMLGPPPSGDFTIRICTPDPAKPPPDQGSKGKDLKAPTGLTTWGFGSSPTRVALKWNKVKGADYYRVYRKGVAHNIGSSEDTLITLGGLRPNTKYRFHVRAVADDGRYGPRSSYKWVRTKKKRR